MTKKLQQFGIVPFFIQQLESTDLLDERVGRVTSVQRSKTTVISDLAERQVNLSLTLQQAPAIERPTVGDWVVMDESLLQIEQVLDRKSLFKRVAAGNNTVLQLIAANIDILFIVTSCNDEFKESRLERYLLLCENAGAQPVIVLTKSDLTNDVDSYIGRARSVQSGVPVESVSALNLETLEGVRAWVDDTMTVALVGSSGVGKSTLLNALAGDALAATNDIREHDDKGRHTTTHRELFKLSTGGLLIDVPGMRELRVAEIDQSIGAVFKDIEQLALQCQFSNCRHENEPGCAVIQAIENNKLDHRRLINYQKLLRENALATANLAEKRAKGRGLAKMIKEAKHMKQKKSLL